MNFSKNRLEVGHFDEPPASRAYTWPPARQRAYGGMGANASREFQYAETETQQLTRLARRRSCGKRVAQCYLELGQFRNPRRPLTSAREVCGLPWTRWTRR